MARKIAPRLGLNKSETETVEWLVRYHLLMSDMAQKRDISDPRTVRDFAKAVKSVKRLDLLTVLTVCDIRGVGPNTWNNWKATLLRALYAETKNALQTGMEDLNRANRGAEAKKALRGALQNWNKADLKTETGRHYGPYWQGLNLSTHVEFAEMLRELESSGDAGAMEIRLHPDEDRDATRACFAMADHPGFLPELRGRWRLSAQMWWTRAAIRPKTASSPMPSGYRMPKGTRSRPSRLPRLTQMIQKTLKGEVVAGEALKSRDKIKKRENGRSTCRPMSPSIMTALKSTRSSRWTPGTAPGLLYDLTRHPGQRKRLHRQCGDRDLWRTGRGHVLCQGHVRAEIPFRKQAARS